MQRELLKSKIHRAVVTEANLHYVGSLTLGWALCEAADLAPYEFVHITNLHNGTHWVTYVIRDDQHPGTVCLNGTSARHFHPGDLVIIMAYGYFTEAERASHRPRLVYVDEHNRITEVVGGEMPFTTEPARRPDTQTSATES
ncbi:MAG: aspartate 1-decarboxylase [Firmicutes bacterium]|nr:aspartate 1-decarboxylase [Bacillota bacterium]